MFMLTKKKNHIKSQGDNRESSSHLYYCVYASAHTLPELLLKHKSELSFVLFKLKSDNFWIMCVQIWL